MTLQIFGYPGCTTVKKAVRWAEENKLDATYSHFSKVPDLAGSLQHWAETVGVEKLFNTRAQTFKKLASEEQAAMTANEASMIAAMAADPRFIKRPVGTDGKSVLTGFVEDQWTAEFGS